MNSLAHLIEIANQQTMEIKEFEALGEEILLRQPEPGKWSVCQVTQHLNLTYQLYMPRLVEAIDRCTPVIQGENDQFRISLVGKMMIGGSLPRNGRRKWKIRTFSFFTPDDHPAVTDTFRRFFEQHDQIIKMMRSLRTMDHSRPKVISAAGPMVKFGLGECLAFLQAHQQRHIVQAKEILDKVNPPKL